MVINIAISVSAETDDGDVFVYFYKVFARIQTQINSNQVTFCFNNYDWHSSQSWICNVIFCNSGGSRISPRWGRQPSSGRQPMILPHFPKNCMKLKEFGPGGVPRAPLDPPTCKRTCFSDQLVHSFWKMGKTLFSLLSKKRHRVRNAADINVYIRLQSNRIYFKIRISLILIALFYKFIDRWNTGHIAW